MTFRGCPSPWWRRSPMHDPSAVLAHRPPDGLARGPGCAAYAT